MPSKPINIEVLMSTYNGEKYLKQQLDSILAQNGNFNLKISVRDDGSTDLTGAILKEYQEQHGINVVFGLNIGVNASMMALVNASEPHYDFFAFSDQDDVWAEGKLREAVKALNSLDSEEPLLWSCMEELTDENLTPYSLMPFPKYLGDFYNAIIQNKTAGHTQVFNRILRDMYIKYPHGKMYVYDWVLYIIASAFGRVCFCDKVCGKYRQHGANAIGYDSNPIKLISRRLKRLLRGDYKKIAGQMIYLYEFYKDDLKQNYKEELERFFNSQKNVFKRISYVLTTKVKRNSKIESFQFKILYVLGFYNKFE